MSDGWKGYLIPSKSTFSANNILPSVYHTNKPNQLLFPNQATVSRVTQTFFNPWRNLWIINVTFHIFSSADQLRIFFNQIIKNVCLALMQPSKARCGLSYFKQNQSINQSMRARLSWECCIKTQENTYSLQNLLKKTTFKNALKHLTPGRGGWLPQVEYTHRPNIYH